MTSFPTPAHPDSRAILARLWQGWVRPYLGRLLVAFLLMAIVAASASAYPLLTRYIFNALADGRAIEVIWLAPPAIIILALVKGGALFAQTVQVNALALRVTTDLQKDMARTLIDADLAVLTREPAGAFMSRIMNDLNLVRGCGPSCQQSGARLSHRVRADRGHALAGLADGHHCPCPVGHAADHSYRARQRKASGNLQEHMEGSPRFWLRLCRGPAWSTNSFRPARQSEPEAPLTDSIAVLSVC